MYARLYDSSMKNLPWPKPASW